MFFGCTAGATISHTLRGFDVARALLIVITSNQYQRVIVLCHFIHAAVFKE
jgi:hypothetical protein